MIMKNWQVMLIISDERILELTELEKNRVKSLEGESLFGEHLWNYYQFISWARWYPDLFVEIFKSKESNRQLHFDQRVFMRCDLRFMSMYGTFSRGYAKTYTEVLDDFIAGILYPNITLSVTAQTRENSAALLEDKFNEIISDFPLLVNEIEKYRFSKNDAFIKFKSGSTITNLANAQTSKGSNLIKIVKKSNYYIEFSGSPINERFTKVNDNLKTPNNIYDSCFLLSTSETGLHPVSMASEPAYPYFDNKINRAKNVRWWTRDPSYTTEICTYLSWSDITAIGNEGGQFIKNQGGIAPAFCL